MAGSAPTNNSAVQFEQQQAAEADQKEAQRQQQLQQGITAINAIYDPQPVMTGGQQYNWSSFKPQDSSTVPTGYTAVQAPARSANNPAGTAPTAQPAGEALQDATGKLYYSGDPLTVDQTPTGKTTGGFGDDYYNTYNQKILDYDNPQEQRQYDEAQRDLQYSLARAGTLQSSTAADKQGELGYQDAINKAQIVSNANDQTGQLRDSINADKQSLINQLYTTDDPTLTANLAQSSAQASQLKDPTLTPMAGLFNTALTTVGSALSPLTSPYSVVQPGAGAAASPTPAAASASSGKTYS